jgi:Zn-dependent protease
MNLLLGVLLLGWRGLGLAVDSESMLELCFRIAHLSLLLCFFNLLPLPPLDGSRVVRNLVGMSYETYERITPVGIMALIVIIQVRPVMAVLYHVTDRSARVIANLFGMPLLA